MPENVGIFAGFSRRRDKMPAGFPQADQAVSEPVRRAELNRATSDGLRNLCATRDRARHVTLS